MNELMEFFSKYTMDWIQISLLALGVTGASGLAIKKLMDRNKKHRSKSNHSENQNIIPFSITHDTHNHSMVTEEVNNFLMPKLVISGKKDGSYSQEDFKVEKPSVHSNLNVSPEYHPPVTDFVADDMTNDQNQQIKKEEVNEFTFLDSFEDNSKIPKILSVNNVLSRTSVRENTKPEFPILTKEDIASSIEKKITSSFALELPSLTTLYPPTTPKVDKVSDLVLDTSPEEPSKSVYKNKFLEVTPKNLVLEEELTPPVIEHIETAVNTKVDEVIFVPSEITNKLHVEQIEHIALVKPNYYTGIPTLTDIVQKPIEEVMPEVLAIPDLVQVEEQIEEKFVPTVKSKIDEEKFEFTKKYHQLIEEALFFDAQDNKESAMSSLLKAEKFIENIRVKFYLKIAMQSYKNAIASNALPSIINQFYIIEKEKLMKENAQKKQDADVAAFETKKQDLGPIEASIEKMSVLPPVIQKPISTLEVSPELTQSFIGNSIVYPKFKNELKESSSGISREVHDEAFNSETLLSEELETVSFKEAFITNQEEVLKEAQSEAKYLENFVSEVEKTPLEEVAHEPVILTVEENEPPVEFAPFEDPVEHDASEGLLSDPELSPVAEIIQQEIENTDVKEPEKFFTQTVTPAVDNTIDFQDTEHSWSIDSTEVVNQTNSQFVQDQQIMNTNLQSKFVTQKTESDPDNYAKVISSLERTSDWFKKNDNMKSYSELTPIELVQYPILKSDRIDSLEVPVENSFIDDEFSDEETKNKFMDAFGDILKHKSKSETPTIIIHRKRNHTVWVNWMFTEGGKIKFKNAMIELSTVWGTKTAIEDLNQQLQELVGLENQFSVVSVFEAK